jgi:hypothetical protein
MAKSPKAEITRISILGTFTGSEVIVVTSKVVRAADIAKYLLATDCAEFRVIAKYYFVKAETRPPRERRPGTGSRSLEDQG